MAQSKTPSSRWRSQSAPAFGCCVRGKPYQQLGILALSHLSPGRTTRRLPKLGGCRLPIEGVVARAVLFQVIEPRDRLLDARPVAGRHLPHYEIRPVEMLEPF